MEKQQPIEKNKLLVMKSNTGNSIIKNTQILREILIGRNFIKRESILDVCKIAAKSTPVILSFIVITSCSAGYQANKYLPVEMNKKMYDLILAKKNLNEGDTLWLNKKIVYVKEDRSYFKIGKIYKGREKGFWYSYYYSKTRADRDTIMCHMIEEYNDKDTLGVFLRQISREW